MPQAAASPACRRAPAEAIVTTPASLSAAISSGFGAWANEATGTCPAMISLTRSAASGASAGPLRRAEVQHGQVGHHHPQLVRPPVAPHPAHHLHPLDEHPRPVPPHPAPD